MMRQSSACRMCTSALSLIAAVSVLADCAGTTGSSEQVARTEEPFSNQFGGDDCPLGKLGIPGLGICRPDHEAVTTAGLSFLRPEIANFIARQNALFDACNVSSNTLGSALSAICRLELPASLLYGAQTAYAHFDNCTFQGSLSGVSRNLFSAVVSVMDNVADFSCTTPLWADCRSAPSSGADALTYFAASLHTIQDFYSHTNWVENGQSSLFDTSLGPFPVLSAFQPGSGYSFLAGLAIVDDPVPPQPHLQATVNPLLPQAKFRGSSFPALISGVTSDNSFATAPQDCPLVVRGGPPRFVTHDELAKDDPNHGGYTQAVSLAVRQTEHEWCRFMNLVFGARGAAGTQHICKQWVGDIAAANAACQDEGLVTDAQCCPAGQTRCAGVCADLDSDPQNCGSCGNACNANGACSTGVCCPSGQTSCGGTCLDLNSDPQNCGSCGSPCNANEICSSGLCCPSGQTNCSGLCVDLQSDVGNCGSCGNACAAGQVCVNQTCQSPVGQTTYTYTGNQFLYIGGCCGVSNVAGSFTVPSALAPNTTYNNLVSTITAYSFTDGRYTWTPSNYPGGPVSPFNISNEFFIGTDAQGQITSWRIDLVSNNPDGEIFTQSADLAAGGDRIDSVNVFNNYVAYSYAPGNPNGQQGVPGTWH